MTDEIRALLSGYAAGTLTEAERGRLFQASLDDPAVFEALAQEQPVRDLLEDPAARSELLSVVQDRPFTIVGALRDWFERPKSKVLAAVGLALLVAIGVKQSRELRPERRVVEVAMNAPANGPGSLPPTAPRQEEPPPPVSADQPPAKRTARAAKSTAHAPAESPKITTPDVVAMAPAPPPAPAKAVPAPSKPMLSWVLMSVDAAGNAQPVEQDHAFAPGEKARIRIESASEGLLSVRQGNAVLYAGTISPDVPVVLGRDFTFEAGSAPGPIDVEWGPGALTGGGVGSGTGGGVYRSPDSSMRTTLRMRDTAESQSVQPAVVAPKVPLPQTLRIQLHAKNP